MQLAFTRRSISWPSAGQWISVPAPHFGPKLQLQVLVPVAVPHARYGTEISYSPARTLKHGVRNATTPAGGLRCIAAKHRASSAWGGLLAT